MVSVTTNRSAHRFHSIFILLYLNNIGLPSVIITFTMELKKPDIHTQTCKFSSLHINPEKHQFKVTMKLYNLFLSLLFTGLICFQLTGQVKMQSDSSRDNRVTVRIPGTGFTVTIPDNWVADSGFAHKLGLRSFFYPVRDTASLTATYFYATCYPKIMENQNLKKFVKADMQRYYENYPYLHRDSLTLVNPEGILAARNFRFTGFHKKYGEQTIFMESKSAIIVIVFSAKDKSDYENFKGTFDRFFKSFQLL